MRESKLATVAVLAVVVAACGGEGAGQGGSIGASYDLGDKGLSERGGGVTTRLIVGSKDFAEQEILGQITLLALEAAGSEVVDSTGVGSTEAVREALTAEEIDMYWEYTGTGALIHLAQGEPPDDPQALYREVARLDLQRNDIEWLQPAPADNTYVIAAASAVYQRGNNAYDEELAAVTRLSDLGRLIEESPDKATVCVGPEFNERADGLPGLEEHYGFGFPQANVFVLPDSTVYGAVDEGQKCNFGSVFATSGYVPELNLRLLEDDEGFFPAYNPSLTMRAETLESYPELKPLFEDIAERLDTETLRRLSAEVLVDQRPADAVAQEWMEEQGLI
ncbi:MAG: glycine/betaine ABC transporter substrate-binding protein [Nocardioidaceae bacterium]|nr:glycine/betaine ABC transporter substrate-binding protein [Nocardioidaceae bacterium]